jgi:lantibiotic modifying enzyme
MRGAVPVALVLLAGVGGAGEPNPVQPAAAERLRDPKACVRLAEEAGSALLARARDADGTLRFAREDDAAVYAGDAGVAILFVGLYRATRERKWLDAARKTLDGAVARAPGDPGLYTGRAGIGQVCLDAHRASGEKRFLAQARECAKGLGEPEGWASTDIIRGAAGIGIFQLNLSGVTRDAKDVAAARRTGEWLAARAIRADGTACWPAGSKGTSRIYTGFSHGAAGIGYFLLELSRATGDPSFRMLAEEAGRFVTRHAMAEGEDGWLWYRTVPPIEGEEIRVQWCHGPPGNGLFFAALSLLGQAEYEVCGRALARCVATTRRKGRTARAGGCQCHGVAGNAELLLEAYRQTADEALLAEARAFASALVVPRGDTFALETGYDPSYMLGLAGIGHFFLRLADPERTPLPLMVEGPVER